jgi:translation initiation factor IF-1
MSNTKKVVTKEGIVKELQAGGMFKVEFTEGEEAWGVLSGKMRKFRITILPGDKVKVEFSPHDLTRGRITYRYR